MLAIILAYASLLREQRATTNASPITPTPSSTPANAVPMWCANFSFLPARHDADASATDVHTVLEQTLAETGRELAGKP